MIARRELQVWLLALVLLLIGGSLVYYKKQRTGFSHRSRHAGAGVDHRSHLEF